MCRRSNRRVHEGSYSSLPACGLVLDALGGRLLWLVWLPVHHDHAIFEQTRDVTQ